MTKKLIEPYEITYSTMDDDEDGFLFEDFLYDLESQMKKLAPKNLYLAVCFLNGWNASYNGYKYFLADKPRELLRYMIPNTNEFEITINIRKDEYGSIKFESECKHHDRPWNGDMVHIIPITKTEFSKQILSWQHYQSMKYAITQGGLQDFISYKLPKENNG